MLRQEYAGRHQNLVGDHAGLDLLTKSRQSLRLRHLQYAGEVSGLLRAYSHPEPEAQLVRTLTAELQTACASADATAHADVLWRMTALLIRLKVLLVLPDRPRERSS